MDQNLLFATNSNPDLVAKICELAGLHQAKYRLGRFADGEISLHLDEPIALKVAFVLGSFYPPADNLIELLTLINTLHINGVAKVVAVIPYPGYGKSDRLDQPDIPVNARLTIECLEIAGADQFITLNLHSQLINRYFRVPHQDLSAMPLFAEKLKTDGLGSLTVVAPDQGGIDRAGDYAKASGQNDIVVIEKHRPQDDQTEVVRINGAVEGRDLVLIDDMVQTGLTLITAAAALKKQGAKDIYVAATHFVYSARALEPITNDANIKKIYITNSIPVPTEVTLPEKFAVLPIEPLLAEAIKPLLTA
ncbi:MAG: ribose-phosphate pyrophosphokinase [Patescibacteria group bacterium]